MPENYLESVEKAYLTFKFQVVYCPKEKKTRYFNEIQGSGLEPLVEKYKDTSFLGELQGK